jgi:hypothetical protein
LPDADFKSLVKDWGGFEEFIAKLNDDGEVTVERNVPLVGRSGATRKIDVLITHTKGLYNHKVIAECKYWNRNVTRLHVDALVTTVQELKADQGVIFTTKGFQRGALQEAGHQAIRLFKIREPTNEEWRLPGRHVDVWLHVLSYSIGNLCLPQPARVIFLRPRPVSGSLPIEIVLGVDESAYRIPVEIEGKDDKTLEGLAMRLAGDAARQVYTPARYQFPDGGYNGEILTSVSVLFKPSWPIRITTDDAVASFSEITFQVGLLLNQSRLQIDRCNNFIFALAVEDCVNKEVTAACRRREDDKTTLAPIEPAPVNMDDVFKNGSIIQVWIKGVQPFDEFRNREPGKPVARAAPPKEAPPAANAPPVIYLPPPTA